MRPPLLSIARHPARYYRHHTARFIMSSSSSSTPGLRSFPAWFVRGGTSNAILVHRDALPPPSQWHAVLPAAIGSPDPLHGRQLDGMGSGSSSTSKVVVIGAPAPAPAADAAAAADADAQRKRHRDVDVEFTIVQVGVRNGALDLASNCGNISSAVGPAAWDMGLVPPDRAARALELDPDDNDDDDDARWATLRLLNTNTSKLLSRFKVAGTPPLYCPRGDYAMDGVPGRQSPVAVSFLDPAGAATGRALPTGRPVDELPLPGGRGVRASLVDVGHPGAFVAAASLGLDDDGAAASAMGLDPSTESVPNVVVLLPRSAKDLKHEANTTSGGSSSSSSSGNSSKDAKPVDIQCLAMSMGQAHKAVPLTLALCLAAASQLPGTIPAQMIGGEAKDTVTIGHPSGAVDVGMTVRDGRIEEARLLRTVRVLMKGEVYY